ncbi:hypothetical protein [Wukongibacter baidiensis]
MGVTASVPFYHSRRDAENGIIYYYVVSPNSNEASATSEGSSSGSWDKILQFEVMEYED